MPPHVHSMWSCFWPRTKHSIGNWYLYLTSCGTTWPCNGFYQFFFFFFFIHPKRKRSLSAVSTWWLFGSLPFRVQGESVRIEAERLHNPEIHVRPTFVTVRHKICKYLFSTSSDANENYANAWNVLSPVVFSVHGRLFIRLHSLRKSFACKLNGSYLWIMNALFALGVSTKAQ